MSIFGGEIIGTAILILLGDGVVAGVLLARSKAENAGWVVVSFAWGLAVAMGVFAVWQYTGAHLNPAVTLGLASIGETDWEDVPKYLAGEFVGAAIGATLVWLAYLPHWPHTDDPGQKLAVFCTGPAIRNYKQNFVTEVIGTFVLVFGILAIVNNLGDLDSTLAAFIVGGLVGLLVVVIGMSLGGPTGYAINPARDLGPRIMHQLLPIAGKGPSDWAYAWVPVLGPIVGGVLGALAFDWFYPG